MGRLGQERLINAILYGSVAAVLIFFYIPIFTLIAFSFQEGRYLILPFQGLSRCIGMANCSATAVRRRRCGTRP